MRQLTAPEAEMRLMILSVWKVQAERGVSMGRHRNIRYLRYLGTL